MQQASIREACAEPEREEASRLQPEGPATFSYTQTGDSAGRSPIQGNNTDRVAFGQDGSRLIRTVGHLKKAIRGVHKLIQNRYGRKGPPAADAGNYYFVMAVLEEAAVRQDPLFVRDLMNWTERNLPRLASAARAEIDADLERHAVEVTQLWLGEQLFLVDAERDAISFYYALPIDMTGEQLKAKAGARAAQRKREKREAEGSTPRYRCRARLREQRPELSTSAFYRQNPAAP